MNHQPRSTKRKFFGSRFTVILSITLVLFVLGSIAFFGLFAHHLSIYVKENMSITLVLNDKVKPAEVSKLTTLLDQSEYTKDYEYISKEDALKELIDVLGENPTDFLGFNPLTPSIELNLKAPYTAELEIKRIKNQLQKASTQITEITYQEDYINLVNNNIRKATLVFIGISIILLFIFVTLINNTVRLNIYSKRFIIHTMYLVGATPGFIRAPYIKSNILNGIIASVLAMSLILLGLHFVSEEFLELKVLLTPELYLMIFGIILAIGIFFTALASFFAANRYIRMDLDEKHLI